MSELELAVYKTIIWWDLIGYPLTLWECWFYLWDEEGSLDKTVDLSQILSALKSLKQQGYIKELRGFWFLANKQDLVPSRLRQSRWAIIKRSKALSGARLAGRLPFVRLVALVNTMSWDAPQFGSDIDFFIISDIGRLFTVRGLVSLLIQVLGWRRHGSKINNRLCLSFYVSEAGQDLFSLSYSDDPYLRFWFLSAQPLYDDKGRAYLDLIKKNQPLFKDFPAASKVLKEPFNKAVENNFFKSAGQRLLSSSLGSLVESIFKSIQMFYMFRLGRGRFSRYGDGSTAVVISDSVLKFHESDRRPYLAAAFRQRLAELWSRVIVPEVKSKTRS